MHVLDVGANIGEVTLNMAKRVGVGGSVHAFEPDKLVFTKLQRNVNLNSFTNIHLKNFGLGNTDEELVLGAQVDSNLGGSRIQRHLLEGQKIRVTTIDKYVAGRRPASVDVIKIDVEGFEMHVLEGSLKTIQDFKPALFIEVNDNNLMDQGKSAMSLITLLMDLGYREIRHAETGARIVPSGEFGGCHFDIIAT